MPMTVECRYGVQSSTISYSDMVIPEGITSKNPTCSIALSRVPENAKSQDCIINNLIH